MKAIQQWFSKGSPIGLLILGVVVGVGGASGAALFHGFIYLVTFIFYQHDGSGNFISIVTQMPMWQRVLIPTLGGLLVGIIYAITKVSEAEGEGVPEVMEALAVKHGTIRPIVAPVKIITAALTLGTGGSAGREGPVIQIGSAIGSGIAQLAKQAAPERSLLLAAGAAAAIGGTFGAPIAGVLFTVEILHHKSFGFIRACVIVSAAFIGATVAKLLTGHEGLRFPIVFFPDINVTHAVTLVLLGITAALVALLFGRILAGTRLLFKKIGKVPHVTKPALGGFMIGIIGLYLPTIHEPAAYPLMIDLISFSTLSLTFLCSLLVIKMLATGITLGSGGSGGIFAPLLLMGAITGSIFASVLVLMNVSPVTAVPALVILGMAAVFAGAAHAPLTASFITYEMTGDIRMLIPLLLVCFLAAFIAKRINHTSVYSLHKKTD
jgi:CIC family chloride channel protein